MILDTSAIVAILTKEPDARDMAQAVQDAAVARISAVTVVEASLVLGPKRQEVLDRFLETTRAVVLPVDAAHAAAARRAHLRYGRGSGSPARLNVGDCFSYAAATVAGERLLYKGADFDHTDVTPAR